MNGGSFSFLYDSVRTTVLARRSDSFFLLFFNNKQWAVTKLLNKVENAKIVYSSKRPNLMSELILSKSNAK